MKISNLFSFLLEQKSDVWKSNPKATHPRPNHVANPNLADKALYRLFPCHEW